MAGLLRGCQTLSLEPCAPKLLLDISIQTCTRYHLTSLKRIPHHTLHINVCKHVHIYHRPEFSNSTYFHFSKLCLFEIFAFPDSVVGFSVVFTVFAHFVIFTVLRFLRCSRSPRVVCAHNICDIRDTHGSAISAIFTVSRTS